MARLSTLLSRLVFIGFAVGLAVTGLVLAGGGAVLAAHGGSPFYTLSGAMLLLSCLQLLRRRRSAVHLTALNFVATWVWALAEVGLDGWALLPRVDFITLLLPLYSLPPIIGRLDSGSRSGRRAWNAWAYPAMTALVLIGVTVVLAMRPAALIGAITAAASPTAAGAGDWRNFGQDPGGSRFSDLAEIDAGNVKRLRRVWTVSAERDEAGRPADANYRDQATPLAIDGKLFVCLADNTVVSLDAENGSMLWRYDPRVDLTGVSKATCRGVAYADVSAEAAASEPCPRRLLLATVDARMIALSADTGRPCPNFGQGGQISLKDGMGPLTPGEYYQTSPPIVAGGLAIVGGKVMDNEATDEASGVVRAFDVSTGRLAWAWDLGRSDTTSTDPRRPYTRGTPNVWSLMSADEGLGLVYLPTGNSTPDFVGSYRQPLWEKYASSVVALDIRTGQVRWSYQFTHHDLWDYDTSAQPILLDMPVGGKMVPALLQATKGGQLFVLDRRTGQPLTAVTERPVPQTDIPGEWTAATQPFSIGMPSVAGPQLTEASMWGISPFDQLSCRIKFRRWRYEGMYTPPSLQGSINYPSQAGGVDWGSLTIDRENGIAVVPSTRLAAGIRLEARTDRAGMPSDFPQRGTPYVGFGDRFLTALGIPCQQPPYAILTAIDLRTRKVIWERPLGTAEEIGPFGIASHLPFTIGAPPVVGGPVSTAGGLTFIGAVGDRRLRAIDTLTGRELWSDKLPAGSQATPITYRAPRSGRQMVVMVSGAFNDLGRGGQAQASVVAYALR